MFGQHSFHGFLESSAADKRKIAENLLGLDDYARYQEIAKSQKKFINDSIVMAEANFANLSESHRLSKVKIMTLKSQQSQWLNNRSNEIETIKKRLSDIKTEKEILSVGGLTEEQAEKEIEKLNFVVKEKEERKAKLIAALSDSEMKAESIRKAYESSSAAVAVLDAKLNEANSICKKRKSEITQVEDSKGKRCPRCLGVVKEENIQLLTKGLQEDFQSSSAELQSFEVQLNQKKMELEDLKSKYEKIATVRNKVKKEESNLSSEINSLNQEKINYTKLPSSSKIAVLDKEYELLEQRLLNSEKELSEGDPFRELILITESENNKTQKELEETKIEVDHKKKLLPYYEYWVKGFGDKGIRSFLLEERLPALNSRILHWLNILIDNRLKLSFDRDLNENISRYPDNNKKFVYNCLSGGELRRIDLAISQSFAYASMMASGSCPSLIALDEIGTNFDRPGMTAVYRMICELSKDRQVLIVTHDPDLLEMLQGCDTITARMQNGVTKIEIMSSKK
jgi:DNA repair exonuclease SbcCD ATPase subunit